MKYILITGANTGIGYAMAEYLIKKSYGIIAHYHTSCENIDRLLKVADSEHLKFQADLRDINSIKEMFKYIKKMNIRLYGLINNAGIAKDKMILWMKESDWDEVLDLNLKGTFFCIKNALSLMIPQKTGRIINIASPSGIIGREGQANYSASKGGLIAMTKSIAKEVAKTGITVNALCPGIINTRMMKEMKENMLDQLINSVPLKRAGEAIEVAGAAEYLLRDEASYITGTVLRVDGGLTIA